MKNFLTKVFSSKNACQICLWHVQCASMTLHLRDYIRACVYVSVHACVCAHRCVLKRVTFLPFHTCICFLLFFFSFLAPEVRLPFCNSNASGGRLAFAPPGYGLQSKILLQNEVSNVWKENYVCFYKMTDCLNIISHLLTRAEVD